MGTDESLRPGEDEGRRLEEVRASIDIFVRNSLHKGTITNRALAQKLLCVGPYYTVEDLNKNVSAAEKIISDTNNDKTRKALNTRLEEATQLLEPYAVTEVKTDTEAPAIDSTKSPFVPEPLEPGPGAEIPEEVEPERIPVAPIEPPVGPLKASDLPDPLPDFNLDSPSGGDLGSVLDEDSSRGKPNNENEKLNQDDLFKIMDSLMSRDEVPSISNLDVGIIEKYLALEAPYTLEDINKAYNLAYDYVLYAPGADPRRKREIYDLLADAYNVLAANFPHSSKEDFDDEDETSLLDKAKKVFGFTGNFDLSKVQNVFMALRERFRREPVDTELDADKKEEKLSFLEKARDALAAVAGAAKEKIQTVGRRKENQDPAEPFGPIGTKVELEDPDTNEKQSGWEVYMYTDEGVVFHKANPDAEGGFDVNYIKREDFPRSGREKNEQKPVEIVPGMEITDADVDTPWIVQEVVDGKVKLKRENLQESGSPIEITVKVETLEKNLEQLEGEREKAELINIELINDYKRFREEHNEWIDSKYEGKGAKVKKTLNKFFRNSSARAAVGIAVGIAASASSPFAPAIAMSLRMGVRSALSVFGFGTGNRARAIGNEQAWAMRTLETGIPDDVKRPGQEGFDEGIYNTALVENYKLLDPDTRGKVLATLTEIADQKGQKIDAEMYREEKEARESAKQTFKEKHGTLARFAEFREKFSKMSTTKKVIWSGVIALTSVGVGATAGVAFGGAALSTAGTLAFLKSVGIASGTISGLSASGALGMASGALMSNPEVSSSFSENSALIESLGQEYFKDGRTDEDFDKYYREVGDKLNLATAKGALLGLTVANAATLYCGTKELIGGHHGHGAGHEAVSGGNQTETAKPSGTTGGTAKSEGNQPWYTSKGKIDANKIPSLDEQRKAEAAALAAVQHKSATGGAAPEPGATGPKGSSVLEPGANTGEREFKRAFGIGAENQAHGASKSAEIASALKHEGEWANSPDHITNAGNKSDDVVHIFEDPSRPGEYHLHHEGAGAAERFAHEEVKGYIGKHPEIGHLTKEQIKLAEEIREAQLKNEGVFDAKTGAVVYDANHQNHIGELKMGHDMGNISERIAKGEIYVDKTGNLHGLSHHQAEQIKGAMPEPSELRDIVHHGAGHGTPEHHISPTHSPEHAKDALTKATGEKTPSTWKEGYDFESYNKGKSITDPSLGSVLDNKQMSKDALNYVNKCLSTGILKREDIHVSADGKHLLMNMNKPETKDWVWTTDLKPKSLFSGIFGGRWSDAHDLLPNKITFDADQNATLIKQSMEHKGMGQPSDFKTPDQPQVIKAENVSQNNVDGSNYTAPSKMPMTKIYAEDINPNAAQHNASSIETHPNATGPTAPDVSKLPTDLQSLVQKGGSVLGEHHGIYQIKSPDGNINYYGKVDTSSNSYKEILDRAIAKAKELHPGMSGTEARDAAKIFAVRDFLEANYNK